MTAHHLIVIFTFIWIGFVCAISFMEAWVKFRGQGITLPVGLAVGRVVFKALNIAEWLFAVLIIATLIISDCFSVKSYNLLVFPALMILIIQTSYVLPKLDARAEMRIKGRDVAPSRLHFYYVIMEVLKVLSLLFYGLFQLD